MATDAGQPSADTTRESWRALYPFESHYFDLAGTRMHYLDEGTGSPVVMLHGNPTWSFYYRDLVLGLRDECRVVVPDHIGCGLSDKPQDYPYRLEQHITNLTRLLNDGLGLGDITLILHDWGGAIGTGYAVRFPKRVSRLVVLNTAAFVLTECPLRIAICKLPVFGSVAIRMLNGFARSALYMAVVNRRAITQSVRDGYLAPYNSYHNRIANLRFVQDIPLSRKHPSWETIAEIEGRLGELREKPMLICWGDRDFCFTPRFLEKWRQHFPHAEVHRFEHAGHYVLEDAGEAVLSRIRSFLQLGGLDSVTPVQDQRDAASM